MFLPRDIFSSKQYIYRFRDTRFNFLDKKLTEADDGVARTSLEFSPSRR